MLQWRPLFLCFALRYGVRSLARHRRRTALVVATVAISTFVTMVGMAYASAVIEIWQQGAINFGLGHAQVHTKSYWDNPDVLRRSHLIAEDDALISNALNSPVVHAYSRRIRFEGMITAGERSAYFLGLAVSPESELQVASKSFIPGVDQGEFLDAGTPDGLVLGKQLAKYLNVTVGDSVSLVVSSLAEGSNAMDMFVRGIANPPLASVSKRLVYINLLQAQTMLAVPQAYTELAIILKDERLLKPWVEGYAPRLSTNGLDVKTWSELDPLIERVERLGKSLIAFMCFLLFVSAGISVANIVYLLVSERMVEIGTLMALGARPRDVRFLFVCEAGVIALFGGSVGLVLSLLAIMIMDAVGIPFESPFHAGAVEIHPEVDMTVAIVVALVATFVCYLAAFLPARLAGRVEPVVAFRGQM